MTTARTTRRAKSRKQRPSKSRRRQDGTLAGGPGRQHGRAECYLSRRMDRSRPQFEFALLGGILARHHSQTGCGTTEMTCSWKEAPTGVGIALRFET